MIYLKLRKRINFVTSWANSQNDNYFQSKWQFFQCQVIWLGRILHRVSIFFLNDEKLWISVVLMRIHLSIFFSELRVVASGHGVCVKMIMILGSCLDLSCVRRTDQFSTQALWFLMPIFWIWSRLSIALSDFCVKWRVLRTPSGLSLQPDAHKYKHHPAARMICRIG